MYCLTHSLREQATQSFPTIRFYIEQCIDMDDVDPMLNFLMGLEFKDKLTNH